LRQSSASCAVTMAWLLMAAAISRKASQGVDHAKFGLGEVLVAGSHIHRASLMVSIQLFDVSILSDDLLDYQVTFYGSI
jgi:hypothetical protein